MNSSKNSNARIITGSLIIFLGAYFLFENIGWISFNLSEQIFTFRTFLIILGIIIYFNSEKKGFALLLISIGAILFLEKFTNLSGDLFWPLILIIFGLYVIFKSRKTSLPKEESNRISLDEIDDVSIFGGGNKIFFSENFKGGKVTSIFGGSDIDFTNCKLSEGKNVIDLFFLFGGSELIIPKDWNINISVIPIFGGFSDKRFKDPNLAFDSSRTLEIKGLILFGGGEIKSN